MPPASALAGFSRSAPIPIAPPANAAIGVEEVRELKGFFQLSATDGGWRVAIVDAADEMTPAAANALKTVTDFMKWHKAPALVRFVLYGPGAFGAFARALEEIVPG